MTRSHPAARAVALTAAVLLAVAAAATGPTSAAVRTVKLDADRYLQDYTLITMDPEIALRDIRERGSISISAGLERYDVELAPNDLRAPDYRAEETLEDGSIRVLPAQPVSTYAGRVTNRDGATARFAMDAGRLSGMIIDGGDRVFVEPLATFSLAGGPTDYVVYHESDVRPETEPGTCGVSEAEKVSSMLDGVAGEADKARATALSTVQLATEADNEYVSAFGSPQAANGDILAIVNQIDGVYQAELGLAFQVVLQSTYAGADPYSSTDPSTMLAEFQNYWNTHRANVVRDVAHMWTGRDMNGSTVGIAYIGVVCGAPTYSYGISQRVNGTPQRYVLSAHEIGHNFGACHSNSSCNANPSSCNNTIMQSSVASGFTFCQFSRGQIDGWVADYGACLTSGGSTPKPSAPSALTARALSGKRVSLSWRDNSSNEAGFKIERSGDDVTFVPIATLGANVTTYVNLGLRRNRTYYYRVRATNEVGDSGYSNTASAHTPRRHT